MQPGQEILRRWEERAARLHPRMEITGDGLVLGAGTILAKMMQDESGAPVLSLDEEPRTYALLSTGFEKPAGPRFLAKINRACEIWNEGDQALAHIHLAQAGLPVCGEENALRLFVADELLLSGVTPKMLLRAQGFDPAPLALLKYNSDQPRVPAGHGRESGRWTSDGAAGPQGSRAAGSEDDATSEDVVEGRSSSSIRVVSNDKEQNYEDRRARGQDPPNEPSAPDQQLSFTGILIDKRYEEVLKVTHCTYSTPLGTFTMEYPGFYHCEQTMPVPPGLF
jgi:hypothetical protein